MSVTLANKVVFPFANGVVIDVATTGLKHTTPNTMAATLGPLAAVRYKNGFIKVSNDSDAAIEVVVKAGADTIGTFTAGAGGGISEAVDLSAIKGEQRINLEISVSTPGTGTGQIFTQLDVEQPIVTSGC